MRKAVYYCVNILILWEINNLAMKKLLLLLLTVCLYGGFSYGQTTDKNLPESVMDALDLNQIPQSYMDGLFVYPIILSELPDQVNLDPMNRCVCNTYSLLSHIMMGTKMPEGMAERNVSEIEQLMGTDNTLYGLALICKAVEDDENMQILTEATEIIKESAGEDSWEYAQALFFCSNFTMDFERYEDTSIFREYTEKTIRVLENGHKESWLYPVALAYRGWAKANNEDETFIDDIIKGYDLLNVATEDDRNLCPMVHVAIIFSVVLGLMEMYDKLLDICLPVEQNLVLMELKQSDSYISINKNICYAYAKKNDKLKAREHFRKAEETCIAMYGKDSKKYKDMNFKFYKKLL